MKNLFEPARYLSAEDTSRNILAPKIKFVIFMAQRPLANMAVLGVRG